MKYIKTTLTLMAYLNSALNPIIYGFMARSFRENFLKSMRSCLGLRVVQDQPILKTQNNLELQEVSHVNGLRVNRSRGNTLHSSIPQKGLDLRLNQRKSKVKRGSSKRSSNNYSTSLSLSGTNPDHQGFSPDPIPVRSFDYSVIVGVSLMSSSSRPSSRQLSDTVTVPIRSQWTHVPSTTTPKDTWTLAMTPTPRNPAILDDKSRKMAGLPNCSTGLEKGEPITRLLRLTLYQ
ncbi:uncharacterized protein LOC131893664 [Tigriopus californicus]|uniref:uncharacterized protein LOC131893664 n=1 Tax=Tigriopus californicus TaxID=6832 RepID=UPI0027DA1413|nr:uncharacterized protein LOC131893664 [Tigriopus californicus]